MGVGGYNGTYFPSGPSRVARAAAAGAGEHAQIAWDILSPSWAVHRRPGAQSDTVSPGARALLDPLDAARTSEHDPEFVRLAELWHTQLAAIAELAGEPAAPDDGERPWLTLKPYPWVSTRRLRRQLAAPTTRNDLTSPGRAPVLLTDYLIRPRGLARWGLSLAERPDGIERAIADDTDYNASLGTFHVRGADIVLAVTAAVLARRGPDVLEVGLRLATRNEWGLAELLAVATELAPSTPAPT